MVRKGFSVDPLDLADNTPAVSPIAAPQPPPPGVRRWRPPQLQSTDSPGGLYMHRGGGQSFSLHIPDVALQDLREESTDLGTAP